MKHIFFSIIFVLSSLATLVAISPSAEAFMENYSCPDGQSEPNPQYNQDIRHCYAVCPPGQFFQMPAGTANYKDAKCHAREKDSDGSHPVMGDADFDNKQGRVVASTRDGLKCPDGSYRGGILAGQDESKCYVCTPTSCQEEQGQSLVPTYYEACLNSNRSCIRAQERAHVQYMKELRDAAPRGFELPANSELVVASSTANKFCRYYRNMEWQIHYGPQYLYQACLIGYEVGFGGGRICSKEYLFGHDATHRSAPTLNAQGFRDEAMRLPQARKDLMTSDAIKACQDGWAQYSVDYWYCEDDASCQNSLRKDKSRVINPGPRPNKTKYVNEDGEEVETYNTVTTSQSCGSVQSAYFACGLGRGIQNSSFWQIIEMILNILIGLVGIAAVGGLVYGGIRYSAAGDNSTQVSEAKTIIKNVIIGVVLFLVMWAFIQYMIPGGIFSSS